MERLHGTGCSQPEAGTQPNFPDDRFCLGLFDACPGLQNSKGMRAGVEQASGEETAGSGDADDAGYGD